MTRNPYQEQHKIDERAYSPHLPRAVTNKMVDFEYAHPEAQIVMDCERCEGGQMFYKATVGVHKCVNCGELARIAYCDNQPVPDYI